MTAILVFIVYLSLAGRGKAAEHNLLGLRTTTGSRVAACGEPLEADLRDASCGPPPGGGCGPPIAARLIRCEKARSRADGPAFEQREDAALRQGAAAGCRPLRDRFCRQTFPPKPAAAARSVLTDRPKLGTSPQPSGRACDVEEQPSARGGCGLPAAARPILPADLSTKACGGGPSRDETAARRS